MEVEADSVDNSLVLVKQGAEAVSYTTMCSVSLFVKLYRIGAVRLFVNLFSESF